MTRDELKIEISTLEADAFTSKHILECVPHVFGGNLDLYLDWKKQLASTIDVDPRAIAVIGSANVGVSLNPNKTFKEFDQASDVDVAIVSAHHFELAWRHLRGLRGSNVYDLAESKRRAIAAHRTRYIYWGTIATDRILELLPFGKEWTQGLSVMAGVEPTAGRTVNARIYRDFESLRAYQIRAVQDAKSHFTMEDDAA